MHAFHPKVSPYPLTVSGVRTLAIILRSWARKQSEKPEVMTSRSNWLHERPPRIPSRTFHSQLAQPNRRSTLA